MTNVSKISRATLLLAERPCTVAEVAVAVEADLELARRWMRKLASDGVVLKGTKPAESNLGRRKIDAYTLNPAPVKHFYGCWAHGPAHYWCALDEIHRLEDELSA